ncbi:MAG TPA: DnaJ domain-containing protein [Patescibacteria group bacterium]|nr:DnaJ domain-containing protein [Patescibacteria group bacterium]
MLQLFTGILVLVAVMMLARWFATASPAGMVRTVKWTGAALLVGSSAFLLMSGRLAWVFAAALGLIPWIVRGVHVHRLYRTMRGRIGRMANGRASAGGMSQVDTCFLSMRLDHDSGSLSGEVMDGPYRGRKLAELSFDEAMDLHRQCAADAQSVQVLEAWLERVWPDWRERLRAAAEPPPPPENSGAMSRGEAFAVLGLTPDASPAEVKAAYRRLMSVLHPDHGGSDYLAAKINQAKTLLLGD